MSINAYKKITDILLGRLERFEIASFRQIDDEIELEDITKIFTDYGYCGQSIKLVKVFSHFVGASAKERRFSNGLIYLSSEIMYKENAEEEKIHTIRQLTLTTSYDKQPLVNVIVEEDKKSIQELFISSKTNVTNIPDEDKNIEVLRTSVYVGGRCGSSFLAYHDINSKNLLLEKYIQHYPLTQFDDSSNDLLRLCGSAERSLDIIYHNQQPVYAQLSNKYKVEAAGYNSNSLEDVSCIVGKINEEVDAITSSINLVINNYLRDKDVKKMVNKKRS